MFNRLEVIALTNKQTNKQANKSIKQRDRDSVENIHLALHCYVMQVENKHSASTDKDIVLRLSQEETWKFNTEPGQRNTDVDTEPKPRHEIPCLETS